MIDDTSKLLGKRETVPGSGVQGHRKALEASAWLAAVVENSDDAIISKTLDGIITTWNRGAERLFGYTSHETIGQPIRMIIPDDRLFEEEGLAAVVVANPRAAGDIDAQRRVALHVDELLGNQEVVVKNIGPQLARVPGVDGATVLGDGRIVLIINPPALLNRMHTTPTALTTETTTEHRPCILVVDDSLTVRKITGRLLSREGFEVRVAKDGIEAMESLFEQCPDAVVTDIEMPRMDGFELIRNIRNESQFDHLPIIVITSRTADKHRQHALELGANHYLGKPYDDVELINLLEKHKTTNKA